MQFGGKQAGQSGLGRAGEGVVLTAASRVPLALSLDSPSGVSTRPQSMCCATSAFPGRACNGVSHSECGLVSLAKC
jgi:hypothetical protein